MRQIATHLNLGVTTIHRHIRNHADASGNKEDLTPVLRERNKEDLTPVLLRDSGIMASMGSKGDPWDNASAESCISTIKNELVKRRTFTSKDQARLALFGYIESFYNPLRRHSSLDMLSPNDYEARYWEDNQTAAAA